MASESEAQKLLRARSSQATGDLNSVSEVIKVVEKPSRPVGDVPEDGLIPHQVKYRQETVNLASVRCRALVWKMPT